MKDSDVNDLQKRIFSRDDLIRAALAEARIPLNDPITLLAMLTLVHTVMSEMTIIGEEMGRRVQEMMTGEKVETVKKEEVN